MVKLSGDVRFSGQKWGHPIAYEDDIKASDSWGGLMAKAQPASDA